MRRLIPIWCVISFSLLACEEDSTIPDQPRSALEDGKQYIESRSFRRKTLEDSLVDPSNGYSQLRLKNYALTEGGWENLKVWNPPRRAFTHSKKAPFSVSSIIDFENISEAELLALGEEAFKTYPLSIDAQLSTFKDTPEAIGLWKASKEGQVGGLVEVDLPSGVQIAKTCSTCHSSVLGEKLIHGRSNTSFDYGAAVHQDWELGTADVTPDDLQNPTRIPDIRALRYQDYMHWTGTLKNSLNALAVRIETLIITSLSSRLRPPREVAFALAYYFWSLGEEIHDVDKSLEGFSIFETECSICHYANGKTAEPIALDTIQTDPKAGHSSMRGTGVYRIPSLYNVGDRGRFLHDASAESLEELFDSKRVKKIPGHLYGLTLSEKEKASLILFLNTL